MTDYVIGIDGGGTKTQLCAATLDGAVLFDAVGGRANLCAAPEKQVRQVLHELIGGCTRRLGGRPKAICIGAAGIVSDESVEQMKEILQDAGGTENVTVYNDAVIALKGHLGNAAGISITAGTGTICLAQDEDGRTLRVSGWGHLCSDEGSAYDIVREALRRVCLAHDGRIPPTKLTEGFLQAVGAKDFDDLIGAIYTDYQDKERFASLARLVEAVAKEGDATADEVLAMAATRLFEIGDYVAGQLYGKGTPFRVVKNGGVLKNCAAVRDRFDRWMKAAYPLCSLEYGSRAAVFGAVDCAIEAAGR
ncbi:MAG: hypothetical protein IJU16_01745 [Clostridia bacterium]|nr:hypothetical protein [Clostridia bacterium]